VFLAAAGTLIWLAWHPRPAPVADRNQPALLSATETLAAGTAGKGSSDNTTTSSAPNRAPLATPETNLPAIPPYAWRWLEKPSERWQQMPPEPAFAAFTSWVQHWARADAVERAALETAGIELAAARRAELARLIRTDPQRALELMVPEGVRPQLPASVAALLEQPVSGRGDLTLMAALPEEGKAPARPANSRYATIGGRTYEAFVYGRRLGHPTRRNLPLHGLALDGAVALAESPVRVIEGAELAAAKAALPADPVCSVSGKTSTVNQDEVVLDTGEAGYTFLCSREHAARLAASLAAAEDERPPGDGDPKGGIAPNYAHNGARKILLIRVDFSDYTNAPFTAAEGTNILNTLSTTFSNWSYGRLITAMAGAGSDVTPVFRMPRSNAEYNGNDNLLQSDARAAASSNGFNYASYDLDAICFHGGTAGWGYGGLAYVGARGAWLHTTGQSSTANVATHEFGHNFGLNHANYWEAPYGSTLGLGGSSIEYGDPFDTMGSASTANTFSARQKQYLGWLTNGGGLTEWVSIASGSSTNRIYAHDETQAPGLLKGIRVTRDANLNNDKEYFWLEFRTSKANKWLDGGLGLRWAGSGNERPNLLDTTPDSPDGKNDAAIVIGRTFTDTNYNIHITPVAKGGADPEWIDVVVHIGAFPGNNPPTLALAASATNVSTGATVNFTATASDPDGDALAYYWDFGDRNFGTNGPTASKSWSSAGEYLVQCTVSDMKGKVAVKSFVVRVGNPSVARISGRVLYHDEPIENVRVYAANATNFYTFTDSDGFYTLVGLSTGATYTVTGFFEGHNVVGAGFTNPVTGGATVTNINFLAGVPLIGGLVNRTANWNTTNAPLLFWAMDHETPMTNLAVTITNNNTNLVPANGYTLSNNGTNRILSIRLATNVTGTVTNFVVATDTNGYGATNTFTLAINGPPAVTTTTVTTNEDFSVDVDLWLRTTDSNPASTADSNMLFSVSGAVNGSVTLISNQFARFTPPANYFGPASFTFTATDKGYDPALLFYYDFDSGQTSDRSGNARNATLDRDGTGAFGLVTNDAPPALFPFDLVSLKLTDNGNSNSARLYRRLIPAEHNLNNSSWTFAAWFNRASTNNDDFLLYLGPGDGNGGDGDSLQLYLASGNARIRLRHFDSASLTNLDITSAAFIPTNEWHHVAVTYTRTNTNVGDFRLYHNGALVASSNGVSLGMTITNVVVGGHDHTNNTQRWFGGGLDEVALWKRALASNEITALQTQIIAHFGGLSRSTNISLTFNPVNDPPTLAAIGNYLIPEDNPTGNILITIGDVDNDPATLVVTATSSNTNLVPNTTNHMILGGSGTARTLKLVPAPDAFGETTITVSVSDGSAATNRSFTLTVTPVNDPPVLLSKPALRVHAGDTLLFTLVATDVDSPSNAFTFTLIGPPPNVMIDGVSGLVTWPTSESDEGARTLTARVNDNGVPNLSGTNTYTVIILPKSAVGTLSANDSEITITWEAVPGRTYRVKFKNDLADADWQPLPGDVTATDTTASKTDTLIGMTRRFYQVFLLP
jgi:hypothetical protein